MKGLIIFGALCMIVIIGLLALTAPHFYHGVPSINLTKCTTTFCVFTITGRGEIYQIQIFDTHANEIVSSYPKLTFTNHVQLKVTFGYTLLFPPATYMMTFLDGYTLQGTF